MAANTRESNAGSDGSSAESLTSQLGLNRLGEQLQGLASAMADRGVSAVTDRLDGLSTKMSESGSGVAKTVKNMAEGDSAPAGALKAGVESVKDTGLKGVSAIKDKVSEAVGGDNGGKGKDKKFKFINIVEELDLPVPRAVAYQAWTQFEEFPNFMKSSSRTRRPWERQSASGPPAKSPAKTPAPNATTSGQPRSAAKKSTSSDSSPSRPRLAAKKSSSGLASSGRGTTAKKSSSGLASSSRGTTAKKSTTSSS
jgi:hypothetical protein